MKLTTPSVAYDNSVADLDGARILDFDGVNGGRFRLGQKREVMMAHPRRLRSFSRAYSCPCISHETFR